MAGRRSWWKRLGGLLATLTLAVLAFGPGVDGLMCKDGGGLSAAAASLSAQVLPAEAAEPDCAKGAVDACAHGHCHHTTPCVPVFGASIAALTGVQAQLVATPDEVRATHSPGRLIRPPRD